MHVVVVGDVPAFPDAQMVPDKVSARERFQVKVRLLLLVLDKVLPIKVSWTDGAPADVVRDMQGPETHEFEFKRVHEEESDRSTVPDRPMTVRRQGPISAPTPVGSPGNASEEFGGIEGCPACQSGIS